MAAVLIEPVPGASLGCVPPPRGYLAGVRRICDRHGALLIFDEVMCGMGRTGTLHAWQFESEVESESESEFESPSSSSPSSSSSSSEKAVATRAKAVPDLQTIAKGFAGGYQPASALLVGRKVASHLLPSSSLSSTTTTPEHLEPEPKTKPRPESYAEPDHPKPEATTTTAITGTITTTPVTNPNTETNPNPNPNPNPQTPQTPQSQKKKKAIKQFTHGQTYQSHPVAAAVALQIQKTIQNQHLLSNVKSQGRLLGALLHDRLSHHPNVGDIRGRGLFWGVEFVADKSTKRPFEPALQVSYRVFKTAMTRFRVLVYHSQGCAGEGKGDVIMIMPAYDVSSRLVGEIVERVACAVEEVFR